MSRDVISDERTTGEILRDVERRLIAIETQVLKTNGRVTALEKWRFGLGIAILTLAATKWPLLKPIALTFIGGAP